MSSTQRQRQRESGSSGKRPSLTVVSSSSLSIDGVVRGVERGATATRDPPSTSVSLSCRLRAEETPTDALVKVAAWQATIAAAGARRASSDWGSGSGQWGGDAGSTGSASTTTCNEAETPPSLCEEVSSLSVSAASEKHGRFLQDLRHRDPYLYLLLDARGGGDDEEGCVSSARHSTSHMCDVLEFDRESLLRDNLDGVLQSSQRLGETESQSTTAPSSPLPRRAFGVPQGRRHAWAADAAAARARSLAVAVVTLAHKSLKRWSLRRWHNETVEVLLTERETVATVLRSGVRECWKRRGVVALRKWKRATAVATLARRELSMEFSSYATAAFHDRMRKQRAVWSDWLSHCGKGDAAVQDAVTLSPGQSTRSSWNLASVYWAWRAHTSRAHRKQRCRILALIAAKRALAKRFVGAWRAHARWEGETLECLSGFVIATRERRFVREAFDGWLAHTELACAALLLRARGMKRHGKRVLVAWRERACGCVDRGDAWAWRGTRDSKTTTDQEGDESQSDLRRLLVVVETLATAMSSPETREERLTEAA